MKHIKVVLAFLFLFPFSGCGIQQEDKVIFSAFLKEKLEPSLGIIDTKESSSIQKEPTKGIISTYIGNLDADMANELLVIHKDEKQVIILTIYEVEEGIVRKYTTINESEWFDFVVEETENMYLSGEELVIYIKENNNNKYIMIEKVSYIDGGVATIGAFLYNGKNIKHHSDLFYENNFLNQIFYSQYLPDTWKDYDNTSLKEHRFMEDKEIENKIAIYAKYYDFKEEKERIYNRYFIDAKEVIKSYYNIYGINREDIYKEDTGGDRYHMFDYDESAEIIKLTTFYKTYGENARSKWTDFTRTRRALDI